MRLYVDGQELLFLDGLLQRLIVEEQVPPCAYALAGKVKRMIADFVERTEAIPRGTVA